jgi:hypothetical protein
MTKARVSFTSTGTDTSITIQLRVSSCFLDNYHSEYYNDYAFISELDNAAATSSSGYYSGSRICGEKSVSISIPVPSAGSHFIDIGYQKSEYNSGGSDCAWFTVTDYTGKSSVPPDKPSYTVSFSKGTGTGTAPASQTVEAGTAITLPEQGEMTAPVYHTFDGWKAGEQTYAAKDSFTVTADTEFVAQWKSSIDPDKTYIQFKNLEQFPVTVYADAARGQEIARVPASDTGTAVETEPKPQGMAFYPSFLLEIEGVPITYDGPAITVRVDEKKVTSISIPALTSMETDFAYIKIENKSSYSLTLNKGSSELAPLGAAPSIIMSNESVAYQVEPGDVSLYSFMRNTSSPLSFPADLLQFNRGVIYDFTYTGSALTLSSGNSALQSIQPKAPASLTAAAASWNSIQLSWEPVYGATSYKLYRATGSGALEELREAQSTSHIDTGLRSNTAYAYQVKAVSNKSGEGPGSTRVSATTEELPRELGVTVRNATEMEEALALFNNEEYAEWTVAIADSFSLDIAELSSRSSSAALTITSEDAGEKTISLSKLSIGSKVSLVLEKDVTLEGLDKGNRLVQIGSGGTFTLEEGSKVHGNTGGGVSVDGGTFTMNGGEISGNTASSSGGVSVYSNGTFTMSGGKISGNTAAGGSFSSYGGGVFVGNGTFTMSGGEISGNTTYASYGGGVFVGNGTFTMSGGAISGNSAYGGGGVHVDSSGTFTMSGGAISGNSASYNGGGVFVNSYNSVAFAPGGDGVHVDRDSSGTFTMNGGEISGNTAAGGGGVFVDSWGTFTKQSGGVIYGSNGGSLKNSAANGPAVYVELGGSYYSRNTTAGVGVLLDSAKSGSAGGWQ